MYVHNQLATFTQYNIVHTYVYCSVHHMYVRTFLDATLATKYDTSIPHALVMLKILIQNIIFSNTTYRYSYYYIIGMYWYIIY